jgi:NDP-4-keto-2,6-dideoxyhexose 3-C-methyltransferase
MFNPVSKCRICGNERLVTVLELGNQALTGVFPKSRQALVTSGPLTLVKCSGAEHCGLLQLAHSYSLAEMYGENYGYRSGLNPSMVAHLKAKVDSIKSQISLRAGDIVVDIGSNDATTLKQYGLPEVTLVGFDPTGVKFREFYSSNIRLVADFFGARAFREAFGSRKARVVTSFAMFYDLEDPIAFMREVSEILDDRGIWVFEQSYMPSMLTTTSYDTICHERLEYYSLGQIKWMTQRADLEIIDVELNDANGGSFSVVAQKRGGAQTVAPAVNQLLQAERSQRLDELQTYFDFGRRVQQSRQELLEFLQRARAAGKRVAGLGASTKGNVILQYCGIDSSLLYAIGEVNRDKFGAFTPGTHLDIVDEQEILASRPDYVLVLPWHFRAFFENHPRYAGLNLVFPLPSLSTR